MGGDHRCSVCQATFTRPQHVARHMRSHTGDRPYKCQHCGDQFARSDLLSRHVNKCHANEKPPLNTGNARRKGSASASRATTSKQACDQCVQLSLPCDGCNPCAKCVQRKCRCTFVKFHRQTAPAGPGHNPQPALPSSRPGFQQTDDFLLGPAPSTGIPAMADNIYSQAFAFPPMYPNPTDAIPSLPLSDTSDFATKYRARAEILGQTVNMGPGNAPTLVLSNLEARAGQGLFTDPQPETSWMGWSQDPNRVSGAQDSLNATVNRYLPPIGDSKRAIDKDLQAALSSNLLNNTQAFGFTLPNAVQYPQSSVYSHGDPNRRGSVDFNSDSSSTSHSIPSSATSSSLHLPLEMSIGQQQQMPYPVSMDELRRGIQELMGLPQQQATNGVSDRSSDYLSVPNGRVPSNQPQHQGSQGEGGFSSAFGLMSLDDPNILAGLSTDGAPFFSNAAMNMLPQDPNATPMPPNQNQNQNQPRSTLPTPGSSSREAETRELREFWKQYMRTPLSGPGSSPFDTGTGAQRRQPTTPSNYRRVRVSSFPGSKTPTADTDKQSQFLQNGVGANENTKATSNVRTTLHGNSEDLRSYEAAVLARKAPTNLNLVPRSRRNIPGRASASANSSPQAPNAPPIGLGVSVTRNKYELVDPNVSTNANIRPRSSHSKPSSSLLANAFGKHLAMGAGAGTGHVTFASDQMNTTQNTHSHSRESSLSAEDTGSDKDGLRPSFKRLPSQTLGPTHAKRALLSHDNDGNERKEGGMGPDHQMPVSAGVGNPGNISKTLSGVVHQQSQARHPTVNLAERRRRMSAPDSSPTSLSLASVGQGVHHS